jgi:hypothetical protein
MGDNIDEDVTEIRFEGMRTGLDFSGSRKGILAGYCEQDTDYSESIKCWE